MWHLNLSPQCAQVQLEGMGPGLSGVEGPNHAMFFPQEELNYEVLHELTDLFSEWAGVELEPTSVYGVRVYQVKKKSYGTACQIIKRVIRSKTCDVIALILLSWHRMDPLFATTWTCWKRM
jgi:hypothetical protein